MLNREKDIPYCGVRQTVIETATPKLRKERLGQLIDWINNRSEVRYRKDVLKEEAPWTDDVVLQNVKFTNVRREHDRATKWLIENVCKREDLSLWCRIVNIVIFRLYNKWETCELIGMPFDFRGDMAHGGFIEHGRKILQHKLETNPDYVVFTSAFNTGGMKAASGRLTGEQYIPVRPLALVHWMIGEGIFDKVIAAKNPKEVCDALMGVSGIGEFLSYQMFVDFTYCEDYWFSENEFTIAGPGCMMGLDFLFEDTDGMTHAECLFWLRDNAEEVIGDSWKKWYPDLEEHDKVMNVMSLENCFCEFSKYVRCLEQVAEGNKPRARVSYDGKGKKQVDKSNSLFGKKFI